jgi:hypothetical protein
MTNRQRRTIKASRLMVTGWAILIVAMLLCIATLSIVEADESVHHFNLGAKETLFVYCPTKPPTYLVIEDVGLNRIRVACYPWDHRPTPIPWLTGK